MAGKSISELDTLVYPTGDEYIPVDTRTSNAAKLNLSTLKAYIWDVPELTAVTSDDTVMMMTSIGGIERVPVENLRDHILHYTHPVGSIYMSVDSKSPASLFGGTWTRLQNRFLLGAGSTYTNGSTGGAASVTLTTNQMPSHSHVMRLDVGYGNATYMTSGSNSVGGSYTSDGNTAYIKQTSVTYSNPGYMVTSTASGGGNSHNNMPPYLVVYMWKRTG